LAFETGSFLLYVYCSSISKLFFFNKYCMLSKVGSNR
jgi:hypothetical protein